LKKVNANCEFRSNIATNVNRYQKKNNIKVNKKIVDCDKKLYKKIKDYKKGKLENITDISFY